MMRKAAPVRQASAPENAQPTPASHRTQVEFSHARTTTQTTVSYLAPHLVQGAAALALVLVFGFFFLYRIVNLDEGWYLWAARLVYAGQVLYRDFVYTQTPLLPYVYGALLQLIGDGLYQGRAVTVGFALLTALFAAQAARLRGGAWAAALTAFLLATSLYVVAYYSYTATYALTGMLLAAAVWATAWDVARRRAVVLQAAGVGALLALAVATRLSIVAVAPLFFAYLMWRRAGLRVPVGQAFGGAFVLLLLLTIGPFLLLSPQAMIYDIFGFHVDRILRWEWHVQKMGQIILQTGWDLLGLILLNGALAGGWIFRRVRWSDWRPALARDGFEVLVASSVLVLLVVQLVPSTTFSHYNTLQAPLLCITAGIGLVRLGMWRHGGDTESQSVGMGRPNVLSIATVGVILVAHFAHQAIVTVRYDLINWPPTNQIAIVQRAAAVLKSDYPAGGTLLTFNTHLALEAGMTTPRGYEMSVFSYRPTWSTEQARAFNAINNELLMADLRQGVDAVAFTEFDLQTLYGDRAAILQTVYDHYRLWRSFPGFDPFRNRLYLYLPPRFSAEVTHAQRTPFENGITLLGHDVELESVQPGASLDLALYWQAAEDPLDQNYTVFVHLVDSGGTWLAGWDNPPCRGTCPTRTWLPGEVIRDEYTLALPQDLPANFFSDLSGESLRVLAGMYESETGVPVYPGGMRARDGDHRVFVTELPTVR